MKEKIKIWLLLAFVLMTGLSLSRCGQGVGALVDADSNGMKY